MIDGPESSAGERVLTRELYTEVLRSLTRWFASKIRSVFRPC